MEALKTISHRISEWLDKGLRYHQAGRLDEAMGLYNSILEVDPNNADALHLSGLIAHASGETERAIAFIRKAIEMDANQAFFHNNLGNAFKDSGEIVDAIISYQKAIHLQPKYAEAYLNLGDSLEAQNQLEAAIAQYKKVLALHPDVIAAPFKLGHIHRKLARLEESIYWYQFILKRWPENPEAYYFIGVVKMEQEDYDSAFIYLKKVLAIDPKHLDAHFKLAMVHKTLGNTDEAASCYQNAIEIKPDSAELYNNLGLIRKTQQLLPEAMYCFRKALQLNPRLYEAYNNLGNILRRKGKNREAISCFKKALMVNSDYIEALLNMGNSYDNLEEFDEANACYENALKIDPNCALALFRMGQIHNKSDKKDDAISCFQKMVELDLDLPETYGVLYVHLRLACNWTLTELLEKKMDLAHINDDQLDEKINEVPFVSLARSSDPALNLSVARAANSHILKSLNDEDLNFDFSSRKNKNRKKTIGYYSGNFWDHPNGHQTHAIFGCHNREKFNIICYSSGKDDGSLYRNKIKRDCDRFIDIRDMSDVDAAKQIYQDQVDILVDLVGPIDGGRPGICALRPAPVQIRYLGMAGTSGADYYDYLVTDKIVTPEIDAPFYTEKFIHMPNCYMVNSIQPVLTQKLKREDFGLPENGFVFCSFNTNYKFDRKMFHAWMKILVKVPGSVLWLLSQNKASKINLKREAESCGVQTERIVFSEKLPKPAHLARMHLADLALDTRIVNGAASTCDFLRMGLPIITLKGNHFSSRMSASILTAMGLPELITHDLKQYIELAVHLATSEQLKKIRTWLDKNRHANPLFDTRRFVRNLESAYKVVWEIYIQGQEPRPIDVQEVTESN